MRTPEQIREYQRAYRARNRDKLVAQAKVRSRAWYEANRERVLATQKARREADPERAAAKAREYSRAYRERDPARALEVRLRWEARNVERELARHRAWRAAHPKEAVAKTRRSRAKRLGAKGDHSATEMRARAALFGNACAYCGGPWEHDDHVEPLVESRDNAAENMVPSCARCNRSKGNRAARDFIAARKANGHAITTYAAGLLESTGRRWIPGP